MAKEIKLSSGKVVIVDDCWYPVLSRFPWHESVKGYAQRSLMPGVSTMMHRVVAQTPPSLLTDHINGNKLDNRECNLRVCTNRENCQSRTRTALPKSGYTGVQKNTRSNRFSAVIMVDYKRVQIGTYDTPEEAARAYDAKARELHGEFAKQNFPGAFGDPVGCKNYEPTNNSNRRWRGEVVGEEKYK